MKGALVFYKHLLFLSYLFVCLWTIVTFAISFEPSWHQSQWPWGIDSDFYAKIAFSDFIAAIGTVFMKRVLNHWSTDKFY